MGPASGASSVEVPMAVGGVGVGVSVQRLAGSASDYLISCLRFMN